MGDAPATVPLHRRRPATADYAQAVIAAAKWPAVEELSAKLHDGGIVHYHVFQGRDTPFCRALFKTLASVFPAVRVFGGSEFVASKAPMHYSTADLKERAMALRAHLPQIDSHIDTMATTLPRVDDVPLMTDDYAPVDSLLKGR